jgi:hypothetical protein
MDINSSHWMNSQSGRKKHQKRLTAGSILSVTIDYGGICPVKRCLTTHSTGAGSAIAAVTVWNAFGGEGENQ